MRIALDVSPLLGTRAGVGTYVEQLVKALLAVSSDHRYDLYTSHPLPHADAAMFGKYSNARIVRCPVGLMRWRTWWDRVDIFHGMNYKLRGWGRLGTVITIHDLALDRIPQSSRKLFGQRRSFLRGRRMARRVSRVVTVSRATAHDVAELYGVPQERIAVVANGGGADFYPMTDTNLVQAIKSRLGITREFVLASGGAHPRKNIRRLIEAFGRSSELRERFNLVVVGGMEREGIVLHEVVQRAGLGPIVIFAGHVVREELQILYSACAVFAFPSLYEGFGMPVLEAMACGAPVVCSNTAALPEVAGDAAILVDPMNIDAMASAMRRVALEPELREELRRRGFIRAKTFSWERAARELLKVYEDVRADRVSEVLGR